MFKKLVAGHGINDVNYTTQIYKIVEGRTPFGRKKKVRVWVCPYYEKWASMLRRAYSKVYHKKRPTYIGSSVCEEWLYLSNFIKWVDSQPEDNWANLQLDKDFLVSGNKHYSPEKFSFY